jgi:hypothetical protein
VKAMSGAILVLVVTMSSLLAQEPELLTEATLDTEASRLYVLVKKDPNTAAAAKAHNHVVLATGWAGKLALPSTGVAGCRGEISIPVASLVVDDPAMRKQTGLEGELSKGDRKKVRANMLAANQLAARDHSTILVNIVNCTAGSGDQVTLEARISIRSTTSSTKVPAIVTWKGDRFVAKGSFQMSHLDFGFKPYSAFFGAVANLETLWFHFELRGSR